jgi:ketose-bisphosphate aldolase
MAFIAVARVEWEKFESRSIDAVKREYDRFVTTDEARRHVRLHLDHVPVIDEDGMRVDYRVIIQHALELGYDSVMVDGSRLTLEDNIAATREIVELAHPQGVPVEAELGSVFGHEDGPPPPYDELFQSKRGFTDPGEASRFVKETECDWLSVAFGSVHGALSEAYRDKKKPDARLDLEHLSRLVDATGVPIVLHGGSGVLKEYLAPAFKAGVAKMNIGTEIRQAYAQALRDSGEVETAQRAVYERTVHLLRDYLGVSGTASRFAEITDGGEKGGAKKDGA